MLKGTNHNGCRHGYKTETGKKRKRRKKKERLVRQSRLESEPFVNLINTVCISKEISRLQKTSCKKRKKKAFEMRKKVVLGIRV